VLYRCQKPCTTHAASESLLDAYKKSRILQCARPRRRDDPDPVRLFERVLEKCTYCEIRTSSYMLLPTHAEFLRCARDRSKPGLYLLAMVEAPQHPLQALLAVRSTRRLAFSNRAMRRVIAVSLSQVVDVLAPRLATRRSGATRITGSSASRSTSHHTRRWRRGSSGSRSSFALHVVLGDLLGFFASSLPLW
jgi:hypothetical protein